MKNHEGRISKLEEQIFGKTGITETQRSLLDDIASELRSTYPGLQINYDIGNFDLEAWRATRAKRLATVEALPDYDNL